jgi:single-strand DNA-binding protein
MSARSLNRVLLIGNLTRDPEMRYTPGGTAVCTFGLATNRSWVPSDGGDRQEETEYHRIVAWAKLAEICSQLLYKGRKVYVEGRLQTRKWTTQEGTERETTEVVIDNMIALGAPKGKSEGDYDEGDYAGDYAPTPSSSEDDFIAPPTVSAPLTTAADYADDDKKEVKKEAKKELDNSKEEVDVDDIPF